MVYCELRRIENPKGLQPSIDHLHNFEEILKNMSSSPLPRRSEMTPQGYRALSSSEIDPILGSPAGYSVAYDPGQPSIPTPSVPNPSFASGAPISSTTGG